MKIEIYKCDFCKNEVQENQLTFFYLGARRYEVCKVCYDTAEYIKNKYENENSKIFDKYSKEIEALIKEEVK